MRPRQELATSPCGSPVVPSACAGPPAASDRHVACCGSPVMQHSKEVQSTPRRRGVRIVRPCHFILALIAVAACDGYLPDASSTIGRGTCEQLRDHVVA